MKRAWLAIFGVVAALQAGEPLTLEQVAAERNLWPSEVAVNVPLQVPIFINGKPSGSMQAPAGRIYPLKSVGASGLVIDTQGSTMTVPPADTDLLARAEAVKTRLAAVAAAKAASTPVQPAPTPASRSTPTPPPAAAANRTARQLKGDLVALDGKRLSSFDASQLGAKKYLAVYFSASWCGPCRGFTPELVSWYNRKKGSLDKFDVVFVSRDHSEEEMEAYMKEDKMPWPALAYDKSRNSPLSQYAGRGIPCLVIIDEKGEVISHSYEGQTYIGPRKVLKDLEDLIKES